MQCSGQCLLYMTFNIIFTSSDILLTAAGPILACKVCIIKGPLCSIKKESVQYQILTLGVKNTNNASFNAKLEQTHWKLVF